MGRKPLSLKRQEKAPMSEAEVKDLSGEGEKQPESSNFSSVQPNVQTKKPKSPSKTTEAPPEVQNVSAGPSSVTKAKKEIALTGARKSQRLQFKSAATTSQKTNLMHIIEEVTMTESEKDEEILDLEGKSVEEKVQYLLQLSREQERTIEALNLKITKNSSPSPAKSSKAADARYKDLYFESQKKIEALEGENLQLALKLERALGKLEVYEKGASMM